MQKARELGGVLQIPGESLVAFTMEVDVSIIPPDITSKIAYLELYAVLVAFETFGAQIENRRTILYIDNSAALYAVIRGRSRVLSQCRLAHALSRMRTDRGIMLWADYVSSKENIADGFSRDDLLEAFKKEFRVKMVEPSAPAIGAFPWETEGLEEVDDFVERAYMHHATVRDM